MQILTDVIPETGKQRTTRAGPSNTSTPVGWFVPLSPSVLGKETSSDSDSFRTIPSHRSKAFVEMIDPSDIIHRLLRPIEGDNVMCKDQKMVIIEPIHRFFERLHTTIPCH